MSGLAAHIFADSIDEKVGGLEKSVRRVAGYLRRGPAERVVIYSLKLGASPQIDGCECVDIGTARSHLASPLLGSGAGLGRDERFRLDGLLLRSALERELRSRSRREQVVLSFFANTCGFVAQTVCSTLGLPHVCCVRGSDFSRGAKTPEGLFALDFSCRCAKVIVTTSEEQRQFLKSTLCPRAEVRTIYNACELSPEFPFWQRRRSSRLELVTDTGFSYKKGTHLSLEAVQRVSQMRPTHRIRLTVAGNVKGSEAVYWAEKRRELEGRAEFEFVGHLSAEELSQRLLASDLYVSGSLGEGCPNSVITVLGLGLPAVLPACGAIPELSSGRRNVWLFSAGDLAGLLERLTEACDDLANGAVVVEEQAARDFRVRHTEQVEAEAWYEAIAQAVSGTARKNRSIGRIDAGWSTPAKRIGNAALA